MNFKISIETIKTTPTDIFTDSFKFIYVFCSEFAAITQEVECSGAIFTSNAANI